MPPRPRTPARLWSVTTAQERGADALSLGTHLADALGAGLVVATAVADPNGLLSPAELASMSEEHADESLRRAVEILAPREARTAIVSGYSAGHALNRLAEDERPQALVIGSSRPAASAGSCSARR